METLQKMKINGVEYVILDSIQDFRAEDSFIFRKNKLAQFQGNGESKKHIGTYSGELGEKISKFFNYSNWGLEHFDTDKNRKTIESAKEKGAVIQERKCFFSKSNLLKYMSDAKTEYYTQEQVYHEDISKYFENRFSEVSHLEDRIYFSIYDASDNLSQRQNRGYIRSDDPIWKLWRKLILPKISYLSILKLIPVNDTSYTEPLFYFRILLDYQFRSFVHPQALIKKEESTESSSIQKAKSTYRQGSDKYRKEVLDNMPQCPFTKISDERLLVASHIKPYSICIKESREDQALDYLNGLSLSPTYDWLFDQGYITFTDQGNLICGTQLSSYTWDKLNINPNAKNKMRIYPDDREEYLDFHRNFVFLDDINDLL